jgi:hypothetical protein
MKQLLFIIVALNMSMKTCDKKDPHRNLSAKEYVAVLQANKYPKYDLIPKLDKTDIDYLLRYASDSQLIENYPIPAFSAAYYGPQKVGMIILYTVESIRLQKENGASSHPYVRDTLTPKRSVELSELVPYYINWWQLHKNKTAEELKNISPLAGSTLKW